MTHPDYAIGISPLYCEWCGEIRLGVSDAGPLLDGWHAFYRKEGNLRRVVYCSLCALNEEFGMFENLRVTVIEARAIVTNTVTVGTEIALSLRGVYVDGQSREFWANSDLVQTAAKL